MNYCIQIWETKEGPYTEVFIPAIESIRVNWGEEIIEVVTKSGTTHYGIPSVHHEIQDSERYNFQEIINEVFNEWESYWDNQPDIERWMELDLK